jgi:hypothetical protein
MWHSDCAEESVALGSWVSTTDNLRKKGVIYVLQLRMPNA